MPPRLALTLAFLSVGLVGCAQQMGAGKPAIVAPAPDFGPCSDLRQGFYGASQKAVSSEQNRQQLEDLSGAANSDIGRFVLGSIGSKLGSSGSNLAANFGAALGRLSARANEDTELIRQFSDSFDNLAACRRQLVTDLRRDLRARRITRPDATAQAAEIRTMALADASVARDVNAQLNARTLRSQAAISDVDTQLGAEAPASPRRAEVAQVRRTVQSNQKALVTQAAAVDSSVRERAFDVISSLLPASDQRAA